MRAEVVAYDDLISLGSMAECNAIRAARPVVPTARPPVAMSPTALPFSLGAVPLSFLWPPRDTPATEPLRHG